ncbi:MAG: hypothetical protein ABIH83_00585, partial [Candidatus Micrarchaeota archaeon]
MQKQAKELKSLSSQKLKAAAITLQENQSLWAAILITIGAFFIFSAIPFYGIFVSLFIALICGISGYFNPKIGTAFSLLFVIPAFAFQSPAFAWVFVLVAIGAALFELKENWIFFPILQIAIFAPFSPIPYAGILTYIALALGALHLGSKRSLYISIPAIFFILLLSTLWLDTNSAFLPTLSLENYAPAQEFVSRANFPP